MSSVQLKTIEKIKKRCSKMIVHYFFVIHYPIIIIITKTTSILFKKVSHLNYRDNQNHCADEIS
jgi:hypothetical protein